ncbi:MAG TPA: hypothetical protein VIB47_10150 [Dehalococcoidia bacterium]|jgi:hypothetical protein
MRYAAAWLAGLSLVLSLACGGGDKEGGTATATPGPGGGGGGGSSATQSPAATQASGGGSSGGSSGVPDSCSLLTEPQVAAAMAEAVAKKGATSATAALSVCQWEGATTGRRFVYVTIRQAQFGQSVFNNSFKSRADGQAVAGIGKEAIAIAGQNTPNDYRFLTGAILTETLFIQVDVAGPNRPDGDALAALTTVMRTVVGAIR